MPFFMVDDTVHVCVPGKQASSYHGNNCARITQTQLISELYLRRARVWLFEHSFGLV